MSAPDTDKGLYEIVSKAPPQTIDDVVSMMTLIDQTLADSDGLKWFNRLYLMVTEQVDLHPPESGWKDAAWLLTLDVVFAKLYFAALADYVSGSPQMPSAWHALMESRFLPGIDRIQFALAGMNAHINHDLSLALLETDKVKNIVPGLDSPQHQDYEAINGLLATVMPEALQVLATGLLGQAAQDSGKIGRLLAFWDICKARDLAWSFADHLRGLDPLAQTAALAVQDQITGALGRAILVCA